MVVFVWFRCVIRQLTYLVHVTQGVFFTPNEAEWCVFWFTVLQSEVGAKPPSLVTWMMTPSSRGKKLLEVNPKSEHTDVRLRSPIHRGLADWYMDRQCRASFSNHVTWLRPTDSLNVSHPVVCVRAERIW